MNVFLNNPELLKESLKDSMRTTLLPPGTVLSAPTTAQPETSLALPPVVLTPEQLKTRVDFQIVLLLSTLQQAQKALVNTPKRTLTAVATAASANSNSSPTIGNDLDSSAVVITVQKLFEQFTKWHSNRAAKKRDSDEAFLVPLLKQSDFFIENSVAKYRCPFEKTSQLVPLTSGKLTPNWGNMEHHFLSEACKKCQLKSASVLVKRKEPGHGLQKNSPHL